MNDLFFERIREHINLFDEVQSNNTLKEKICVSAGILNKAITDGHAIYLCGNGGSAADAQHIATEFISRFYLERKAINAEALTTNTSSLTAIGNDYEFDRIFERQLEAKGKPGDVLVGISTSGNSKNVLRAIEYAKKHRIATILLTGEDGAIFGDNADCVINVPSKNTPRIQEAHIFIGHLWAEYIEREIIKE